MAFRLRLRVFDKVVLVILSIFLMVRAPFIFFPLAVVIYMCYAVVRNVKAQMEKKKKKKKKAMKKQREKQLRKFQEAQKQNEQKPDNAAPDAS